MNKPFAILNIKLLNSNASMKKIILLLLIQSNLMIAYSQQAQPQRLLWFTGKLIKPNVLLTAKGDTVYYYPKKNKLKLISKAGTGKQMDNMLAELNHTSKRIEEEIKGMSQWVSRHILPEWSMNVARAYKTVEENWQPLLSNTILLPEGPALSQPTSAKKTTKGGSHFLMEEEEFTDPLVEEVLKEINAFKEKHKDDNLGILPVPPRSNFSYCYPCDSAAVQRYEKDKNRFLAEMAGADSALMLKAMSINGAIQKSGLLADPYFENAVNKLSNFMDYMLNRAAQKVVQLVEKYQNDAYRIPAVMSYWLPVERQLQLMGKVKETPLDNHNYWEKLFATMDAFFADAMQEKNYAIGLNITAILGFERQKQILGIKGNQLFLLLSDFNQFKLNSNISAKLGDEGKGYISGHAVGDNWYHAIPDEKTCRLNWYLHGLSTDRPTYKLITGEMIGAPVVYIGTKEWKSELPKINIEFCYKEGEEPADSVIASSFYPEGFQELWQFPEPMGVQNVTEIGGSFLACFLDMDRIRKEAEKINKDKIEKLRKDFQEKYAKLAGADMKTMNATAMNSQAEIEKLNRAIKELLLQSNPGKYIFTPQVHNKEAIIFKEKLNGREIFPDNAAIIYAFFHLIMEHDIGSGHELYSGFVKKK